MLNTAQLNSSGCQALSVLSFHMFCTFNIVSAKDRQRITQKKEKERERDREREGQEYEQKAEAGSTVQL